MKIHHFFLTLLLLLGSACASQDSRMDIIFDTDANNELDDQHAIAYLLLNKDVFNVLAITTNVTAGGGIEAQVEEVERVATLVGEDVSKLNILPGATANFEDIRTHLGEKDFDGHQTVDFMIESARKYSPSHKLTIVPVGKLTNVALALEKAPDIADKIRIVWLGSNYPDPGEWNLICDIPSMNYVLDTDAEFEIVTCHYDKPNGTDAVRVNLEEVNRYFKGKGPKALHPVTGRHGGTFNCFGDYSLDLFEHINLFADGTRALYDMVTVAIVKNPSWGRTTMIPAPVMVDEQWQERKDNPRTITIWENFSRDEVIGDFIATLEANTPQ